MLKYFKGIIDKWKFRRILANSRDRYRVEFSGEYGDHTEYVDPHDKDAIYYMFHVFLDNPNVKIFLEYVNGSEREIKLGRREITKK